MWQIILAILSGLLYVATILAAYGGYCDPERWTLPHIAVLFFPYFAMVTIVVSAVWLLCRKYVIGAVGILVLLACGPTFSNALPFRFSSSPGNSDNTFKMVTYNCLHLRDDYTDDTIYNRSLHFLIHCNADFVCLQELIDINDSVLRARYAPQLDSLERVYPYISRNKRKEEEFLSKHPFEEMKVDLGPDFNWRSWAVYRLNVDGRPLTVVNVHLPSYRLSDKERDVITEAKNKKGMQQSLKELEGSVYEKMQKAFRERAKVSRDIAQYAESVPGNVIVCGDFNDVPGSWAYRNFVKRGFTDAYAQTGFGHIITYNEHLMLFHIDQILFKGDLVPLYVTKERLNTSDHYPLIAEFEFL